MKLVFSHPTGNANVRAAAEGLADAHMLAGFYTTLASFEGDWLDRLGSLPGLSEIKRRRYHNSLQPYTHYKPWYECGRMLAGKLKLHSLTTHEKGRFSVDSVYQHHDAWVASQLNRFSAQQTGVYAYEDGARLSFQKAKRLGLPCFYDLPIGYWRAASRLLRDEAANWPEWAATLTGAKNSAEKLNRKDDELRLADHIFVASTFTATTLQDFPEKLPSVTVIPYGFPPVSKRVSYGMAHSKLKVLFVGGLSQRKGIANMFAAAGQLKDRINLTVVGRKASNECAALDAALAQHTWIPSLPHAEVLKLMQTQDVLLFPSLFEGFGLVITEAMSQGLPVITTSRTAGPDVISAGENGWLIEAGSTSAIVEALENLLLNPQQLTMAGKAAQAAAAKRPWQVYGQELATAIEQSASGILKR